jgi:hypothetical protein
MAAGLVVLGAGLWATVIAAHGRELPPAVVLSAAGAVATGLLAALAWATVWAPASRRAFEAFAWLGERDLARFRAVSGGRHPATLDGMKRYVVDSPERPDDLWVRAEVSAATGDLAGARSFADRMPVGTPGERADREVLRAYADWLSGGTGDPAAARAATAEIDGSDADARLVAEAALAITVVRHRIAQGDPDPGAALRELRDRLGHRADGVLFAGARRIAPTYLRASVLYIAAGAAVDRLFFR